MVNQAFSFLRPFVNDNRVGNPDNSRYSCLDFTGNSFISHNWVIALNSIECGKENNTVPLPHPFVHGQDLIQILVLLIFVAFPSSGNCNSTMSASLQTSTSPPVSNSEQLTSSEQVTTSTGPLEGPVNVIEDASQLLEKSTASITSSASLLPVDETSASIPAAINNQGSQPILGGNDTTAESTVREVTSSNSKKVTTLEPPAGWAPLYKVNDEVIVHSLPEGHKYNGAEATVIG